VQQNTPKILIISSDTGGGHRSAAQSLAEGIQKFWQGESVAVRVMKAVEDSHHITEKLVNGYNWMLRNKQHWMKYLYWAINRFRPETSNFFSIGVSFISRNNLKNGARTSSLAFIHSRSIFSPVCSEN
jgi:hypothetical protein